MLEAIALFAIRRRVLVVGLLAAVLAFGALAAMRLPIDALPDVSSVQVDVLTKCGGLSPTEVERTVTVPDREGDDRRAAQRAGAERLALRSVLGDHRLRGRHGHLACAPARARARAAGAGRAAALGGRPRARAAVDGPRDDLQVRRQVRAPPADAAPHDPRLGDRAEAEDREGRHRGEQLRRRAEAVPGERGPEAPPRARAHLERRPRRAPCRERERRRRVRRAQRRVLHDPRAGHAHQRQGHLRGRRQVREGPAARAHPARRRDQRRRRPSVRRRHAQRRSRGGERSRHDARGLEQPRRHRGGQDADEGDSSGSSRRA